MRGKPRRSFKVIPCYRLIPARAGKTSVVTWGEAQARAHPRACGENAPQTGGRGGGQGSSPRVRGKPVVLQARAGRGGLIPARAGKTRLRVRSLWLIRAHPRACGENMILCSPVASTWGSSPRVRGKLLHRHRRPFERRLIPARAGKTRFRYLASFPVPAHPRACGENPLTKSLGDATEGSSPRVRGKRKSCLTSTVSGGLIPARTGKTQEKV